MIIFILKENETLEPLKAYKAVETINKCVGTDEFKNFIINHRVNGKPGFADCPFTPDQIYSALKAGDEVWNQEKGDGFITVQIRTYRNWKWWSKVIGYTDPLNSPWINTSSSFFKNSTIPELAGHIMHESMHILGFVHPRSSNWGKDVPYALGNKVYEMAQKLSN